MTPGSFGSGVCAYGSEGGEVVNRETLLRGVIPCDPFRLMSRQFLISCLLIGVVVCSVWELKAEESYAITIGVVPGQLRYDVIEFEVIAGSQMKVTFDNNGLMPHNLLFTQPGKGMEVVNMAMAMGAEGYAKG